MSVIVSQPSTLKPGQALLVISGQPDLDPGSLRLAIQQAGKFRFLQSNRVGDAWGTTRTWLWPESAWREDDVLHLILGQEVAWNLMANITYLLHLADDFSEIGTPERMAWKAIRLPSDPPAPVDEGHSPVRPAQSTPISTQAVPKPEPAPSSLLLTQEAEIREDSDNDAQRISGRAKGASGQQKSLVPAWVVVALGFAAIAVLMAIPILVSGSADNHAGTQKVSPATAETASMPASVSDHEICTLALNVMLNSWDQSDAVVNTVAEARRRGLTVASCRQNLGLAAEEEDSVPKSQEAYVLGSVSDHEICSIALNAAKANWEQEPPYVNTVAEARGRGLTVASCRQRLGLAAEEEALVPKKQAPYVLGSVSDHEICSIALNAAKTNWDHRPPYVITVAEAHRRGLTVASCRQRLGLAAEEEALVPRKQAPYVLGSVSDHEICSIALNAAKTAWDHRPPYVITVAEARRRGLTVASCRQRLGLAAEEEALVPK
jgi:hypothetical protein